MADTPARAAWRAIVSRLTPEALREAAHLAVDAAFDAANDADAQPRRGAVRKPWKPDPNEPVDEVAMKRAGAALARLGVR